jgi:molybdopterin synthase catalytic subunit
VIAEIGLTSSPIDIAALQESVRDLRHGGIVTFTGEVRAVTGERLTDRLFYEAHESMAIAQMRQIALEEADRFDAAVAIVHRIGELRPGDTAVVCIAACAHRAAAFDCCRNLIDRIKQDVPIWKKEFGSSGEEWIS